MQTYLPSSTGYYLSSGRGMEFKTAKQRGRDIISLQARN